MLAKAGQEGCGEGTLPISSSPLSFQNFHSSSGAVLWSDRITYEANRLQEHLRSLFHFQVATGFSISVWKLVCFQAFFLVLSRARNHHPVMDKLVPARVEIRGGRLSREGFIRMLKLVRQSCVLLSGLLCDDLVPPPPPPHQLLWLLVPV